MATWEAYKIQCQSPPNDEDYIQMKFQSTRDPKRDLDKVLTKLKKPTQQDRVEPEVFVREMKSRCGKSFVGSFFMQKSPTTFLVEKFFSLGLINTGRNRHVIANMSSYAPLYVYECKATESHRYSEHCNRNLVLVNESDIRRHFHIHEVTITRKYVAEMGTVYFFFTSNLSFFVTENIDKNIDMDDNDTSPEVEIPPTKDHDQAEDDTETDVKCHESKICDLVPKSSGYKSEDDIPVESDDFIWFLERKYSRLQKAVEQEMALLAQLSLRANNRIRLINKKEDEVKYLHRVMCDKLQYMEKLCADKHRELLVLKGEKEREIFFLKRDHDIKIRLLKARLLKETDARFECERKNAKLQEQHENDQEINEQLQLVIESLEKQNLELKQKINNVVRSLNTL